MCVCVCVQPITHMWCNQPIIISHILLFSMSVSIIIMFEKPKKSSKTSATVSENWVDESESSWICGVEFVGRRDSFGWWWMLRLFVSFAFQLEFQVVVLMLTLSWAAHFLFVLSSKEMSSCSCLLIRRKSNCVQGVAAHHSCRSLRWKIERREREGVNAWDELSKESLYFYDWKYYSF